MSQPRLYLDEDAMHSSVVFGLRARYVDILTALEAGMINREDQEHLAVASAAGRVLYTFNLSDYCVLHQVWASQQRFHGGRNAKFALNSSPHGPERSPSTRR